MGDHPADLVLDQLEVGQRTAELAALLDVIDRQVEQLLGAADRAGAEADAPVVEDLHGDPEALAGIAEHVLGRHLHVVEAEPAEVVCLQAHRVVALADLEALHPLLENERDVAVLAVDLGAGEGRDHVRPRAVADVALLPVQDPGAVGLLNRARLHVVGVGARLGLCQGEGGELAAGGEVGEPALLLLVRPEQRDALEADRLVDAEDDRQRRVDLADGLEDARVAGLREALPAVLLVDVEAERADLAEVAKDLVGDPALLLRLPGVVMLGAVLRGSGC